MCREHGSHACADGNNVAGVVFFVKMAVFMLLRLLLLVVFLCVYRCCCQYFICMRFAELVRSYNQSPPLNAVSPPSLLKPTLVELGLFFACPYAKHLPLHKPHSKVSPTGIVPHVVAIKRPNPMQAIRKECTTTLHFFISCVGLHHPEAGRWCSRLAVTLDRAVRLEMWLPFSTNTPTRTFPT